MSKISEKLFKVFVYGTLKRGEPNHHWLTRPENGVARFLGSGITTQKFPLVIGTRFNIPFLLDQKGTGHNIQGEIYEVDEAMLANLDILEEYPSYYDREEQTITMNEVVISCWLYLIRKFPTKLLEKVHLASYRNTLEQPYTESVDSNRDDMYNFDHDTEQSRLEDFPHPTDTPQTSNFL